MNQMSCDLTACCNRGQGKQLVYIVTLAFSNMLDFLRKPIVEQEGRARKVGGGWRQQAERAKSADVQVLLIMEAVVVVC